MGIEPSPAFEESKKYTYYSSIITIEGANKEL
jgi:hypothetical protein